MEKFRSRKFCLLLYPQEDKNHSKALLYVESNFDYAYIYHTKDLDENSKIKKPHCHVVLSCSNAKWNTAIAQELNLPINYIQKCRSLSNALEYLIHYNDDTKEQYSIEEVKGNLRKKLQELINNDGKSENDKILEIFDYIDSCHYIDFRVFYRYCATLGMWDICRRASFEINNYIKEHNAQFLK